MTSKENSSTDSKYKHGFIGAAATLTVVGLLGVGGVAGWKLQAAFASSTDVTTTPTTALASSHPDPKVQAPQ